MKKLIVFIVVILNVLCEGFSGGTKEVVDPNYMINNTIIVMSAEEFAAEFIRDENAAAKKYEGKTLQLTGYITDAAFRPSHGFRKESPFDVSYLGFLDLDKNKIFISCYFDVNVASGIKLNTEMTIQGEYFEYTKREDLDYRFIVLRHSRIVSQSRSVN